MKTFSTLLLLSSIALAGPIEDANRAIPGSTITVLAGSYSGGTITNDVTLVADGDVIFTSRVVLAGAVTLDGFTHANFNGQGIEVRHSNCTIRNFVMRNYGRSSASKGIWIREHARYDNTLIEDGLFTDWGSSSHHSSGIKVSQSGGAQHQGTIIRRVTVQYGASGGNSVAIQLYSPTLCEDNEIHHVEDAFEVKGSGCIIRRNHVHHNDGGEQLSNRSGSNNVFDSNVVHHCDSWPMWMAEGDNVSFTNNLIYTCPRRGFRITGTVPGRYSGSSNVTVAHNTFVGVEDALEDDSRQTQLPQGLLIVNNIFAYCGWSLPASMMSGAGFNLYWQTNPSLLTESDIVADPLFVDPDNDDFRLGVASPAVGAAFPVGVPSDILGTPRDATPDIGAYERIIAVPPELLQRREELLAEIADLEAQLLVKQDELALVEEEIASYQ